MPRGVKICTACNSQNHINRTSCHHCGAKFRPRRTPGTTKAAGYGVSHSGGRTQGTTEAAGYGVSQQW